jgi:tetratricopeptide (TPR) repeat protein
MKIRIGSTFILAFLLSFQITYSQSNEYKAVELEKKAVNLLEINQVDEAINLLQKAQKLDSYSIAYPYEIACTYYLKHDYKAAIKTLKKIQNHFDVKDKVYELLGNCYDHIKRTDAEVEVYEKGLIKFPYSGCLYLELGIIEFNKNNFEKALFFFEKGIYVAPTYASNYYWASKIYFRSSFKLHGLLYGEIFMNIEKIGVRAEDMSELLYIIYKNIINISSDSIVSLDLNKNIIHGEPILLNDTLNNVTSIMIYKQLLLQSIGNEKVIDMDALDRIRIIFVKKYFSNEIFKTYPNLLFGYEYKILECGHLEAYNHWILKKGNQNEFGRWYESNKDKWEQFVNWFSKNPIQIEERRYFIY